MERADGTSEGGTSQGDTSQGGNPPVTPDPAVALELARRLDAAEAVVTATAVRVEGRPPCRVGQKLLMDRTSPLAGGLGCSELDAQALADAGPVLDSGVAQLRRYTHESGTVEAYLEPYPVRLRLVVLSANPVATFLLRWAADLGWDTALVEPRSDRRPAAGVGAAAEVASDPGELRLGARDAVVATDHDAPMVAEQLATALRAGARFVGMMSSARHVAPHLAALGETGVGAEAVARVQAPVGLDIGGQRPQEIALSILAGIVAADHGRAGGPMADRVVR